MAYQEDPKLLPHAIDEIATREPNSLYGKYPADPTNYDLGFEAITYAQLANAINGVARWLEAEIGRGDYEQTPVIAYFGPNDFRYIFAFVGAIKAGYKLFLPSPRNSLVAHLTLLENLSCTKVIVAGQIPSSVDEILKQRAMRLLRIEETKHLVNHISEPYPYTRTLDEARREGSFVCHSSGTTGIPKPCIYTHEFILRTARTLSLPPPDGYTALLPELGKTTEVLLLPLFHPAGVHLSIINAVYNRTVVIIPSWTSPPSIESLVAILRNVKADWAMTAPFTLEALAKDEAMLDQIASQLKMIVFGGGSLPTALGNVIAKKIRLATFLGSSETAGLPIIYPVDFDWSTNWEYMAFHPQVGAVHELRDEDKFELVLEKSISTQPYQPVFDRFPELDKFLTGDLFKRHPTISDMWAHASRADDTIVFLNGEKTNPVSFESHLSKHPDIKGAIMFGDQRFEAGILIELSVRSLLSPQQKSDYIKDIWPIIEEANQDSPAHARIATTHILFTEPDKPFLRTPKGTVMRKATLNLYAQTIDELYQAVDPTGTEVSCSSDSKFDLDDLESIVAMIQVACKESTALGDVDKDDDMLARGIDSLQVLRLCRNIRSKAHAGDLKPTTIYSNPTPAALAKAIQRVARGDDGLIDEQEHARKARLNEALETFMHRIDQLAVTQPQQQNEIAPHVCVVTGTTGSIGAYILRSLIERKDIGTIYCLNRGSDSATRQCAHNAETDPQLPTTFPKSVHFLQADISHDTFNLEPGLFEQISSSATLVIHNAWSVDFNSPLSSFTTNLIGVENLCRFSAESPRRPNIMFLSSVSAALNLALSSGKVVPEDISEDLSVSAAAGYGESKYVAERILDHAVKRLHIPVIVARIGQVCGATRSPGRWNPKEWIPRLISGSVSLGAIPDSLGDYDASVMDVDWIPVDVLADALVEIAFKEATSSSHSQSTRPQVYHLMNPKRTRWADMLPAILKTLDDLKPRPAKHTNGGEPSITVVSREEWLRRLRDSANDLDTLQHGQGTTDVSPALKLVDFYEEKLAEKVFPLWAMDQATSASVALQQLDSISPQDMEKWIRIWWKDVTGHS